MGQRGPAKKPTGQRHQRRQAAGEVVAAPVERPAAPAHFTPGQAEVWGRVCGTLERLSLLSSADWAALERYCVLYLRWREMEADIAAHGHTQAGNNGVSIPRPEVGIAAKLSQQLTQLESRFGLSPSARSGLTAATPTGPAAGGVRSRPRPGR